MVSDGGRCLHKLNVWLVCSYHPSQQNTFTRKLTREMLRAVSERAKQLADADTVPAGQTGRRLPSSNG